MHLLVMLYGSEFNCRDDPAMFQIRNQSKRFAPSGLEPSSYKKIYKTMDEYMNENAHVNLNGVTEDAYFELKEIFERY